MRFRYIFQPKDLVLLKNERFGVKVDQNKIYQIGQRIGQIVFSPTTNAQIKQIGEMPKTVRGASGFGSTGL
jgi:dUTPase